MTIPLPGSDSDAQVHPHPDNPAPTASPRSRRRLVAILTTAGVLVAAAIGVVLWIVVGSSAESGPEEALQEYYDSYLAGDCVGLDAVATDEFSPTDDADCRLLKAGAQAMDQSVTFEVRDVVTVSDTAAEVEVVRSSSADEPASQWFSVIKVDGTWQVDRPVFPDEE